MNTIKSLLLILLVAILSLSVSAMEVSVSDRLLEAGAEFSVDKSILDAGMYILSVYDKSELKSSYKFTIR